MHTLCPKQRRAVAFFDWNASDATYSLNPQGQHKRLFDLNSFAGKKNGFPLSLARYTSNSISTSLARDTKQNGLDCSSPL